VHEASAQVFCELPSLPARPLPRVPVRRGRGRDVLERRVRYVWPAKANADHTQEISEPVCHRQQCGSNMLLGAGYGIVATLASAIRGRASSSASRGTDLDAFAFCMRTSPYSEFVAALGNPSKLISGPL
jgi:hypothetical protein